MMPKISVIIPVYNVEKYLRECLDSVVNQTLKDIEIICVNDGSTDNSLKILEEYAANDKRIVLIDRENKGISNSRNEGIEKAKGEFVCFINPDDYYPTEDVLETLFIKAIENNVFVCGGEFACVSNDNKQLSQKFIDSQLGYLFLENGLIAYKDYQFDYGYHRFIYKRSFLITNKIIFPDYKRFQDPPFFINAMIKAEKFYAIKKITYAYRCSHKQVKWTTQTINDLLLGLLDSVNLARLNNLNILENYTIARFCENYYNIKGDLNFKSFKIINKIKNISPNFAFFCKIINKISLFDVKFKNILKGVFSSKNDSNKSHKIINILESI